MIRWYCRRGGGGGRGGGGEKMEKQSIFNATVCRHCDPGHKQTIAEPVARPQTASIKPREEGSGSQWKRSSSLSPISLVNLAFRSRGVWRFVRAPLSHFHETRGHCWFQFPSAHARANTAAAAAPRVITASEQRGVSNDGEASRQERRSRSPARAPLRQSEPLV